VKQPALGLVASALVMAIALAYISLFPVGTFLGWVSLFMLALIPMQVVMVVLWGGNPSFAAGMSQPGKGVVLVLFTVLVAVLLVRFPLTSPSWSCRRLSGWPS
jgi:hypothetical protein